MTALSASDFKEFQLKFPNVIQKMDEKIYKYQDIFKKFLKKSLRFIDFLNHNCDDKILDDLSYRLKFFHCEPKEVIYKAGDL